MDIRKRIWADLQKDLEVPCALSPALQLWAGSVGKPTHTAFERAYDVLCIQQVICSRGLRETVVGDGKVTWTEHTDLGSENVAQMGALGLIGTGMRKLTGSLRKPGKHLFCDNVGTLETGAEIQQLSTNARCWQNKGEGSLFPSSWSTVGGDPIHICLCSVGKEMQGVMSKFTQPIVLCPIEWKEYYTTYPRGLLWESK